MTLERSRADGEFWEVKKSSFFVLLSAVPAMAGHGKLLVGGWAAGWMAAEQGRGLAPH